jgi:hypothetical protein
MWRMSRRGAPGVALAVEEGGSTWLQGLEAESGWRKRCRQFGLDIHTIAVV